jgi:hypothetical protein
LEEADDSTHVPPPATEGKSAAILSANMERQGFFLLKVVDP